MLHNMLLEYDGLNEIQWENIEDDVVNPTKACNSYSRCSYSSTVPYHS